MSAAWPQGQRRHFNDDPDRMISVQLASWSRCCVFKMLYNDYLCLVALNKHQLHVANFKPLAQSYIYQEFNIFGFSCANLVDQILIRNLDSTEKNLKQHFALDYVLH